MSSAGSRNVTKVGVKIDVADGQRVSEVGCEEGGNKVSGGTCFDVSEKYIFHTWAKVSFSLLAWCMEFVVTSSPLYTIQNILKMEAVEYPEIFVPSYLSQLNPVHTLSSCFFKIHFNNVLPSTPRSSSGLPLSSISTNTLYELLSYACYMSCLLILSL
jgi:hypothetical protein